MYNIERKSLILDLLRIENTITVAEIASSMKVSKETVRRDLRELEKDNMIKRTHGGAVLESKYKNSSQFPFKMRSIQKHVEKLQLCKKASGLVEDGDTIFLDNSSTLVSFLNDINPSYHITVITNSIWVLLESVQVNNTNFTMICLGGVFNPNNYSTTSIMMDQYISTFHPNKTFISCHGINLDGLFDDSIYEVDIKRMMINNSKDVYILADSSKLNETGLVFLNGFSNIDYLITDGLADRDYLKELEAKGLKSIVG